MSGTKSKKHFSKGRKKESPVEKTEEEKLAELEVELLWCIEQLENGLCNPKQKSDPKKSEEAIKLIKLLQSPNTPLVKKRLIMRNTFGDYRKTIAEEQKKSTSAVRKMKLRSTDKETQEKSKFIRKSGTFEENRTDLSQLGKQDETFSDDILANSHKDVQTANEAVADDRQEETLFEKMTLSDININEKIFKMQTSNNSFRFNFEVS